MASFEIEVSATAEKQLREIPRADQLRLVKAVRHLASEPRPRGCRKLQGHDNVFRIRVGLYRVIYSIEDSRLIVIVLKPGHRKDVYR